MVMNHGANTSGTSTVLLTVPALHRGLHTSSYFKKLNPTLAPVVLSLFSLSLIPRVPVPRRQQDNEWIRIWATWTESGDKSSLPALPLAPYAA